MFGYTLSLVFIVITFGKLVYFAQSEENCSMESSYCDEKELVDKVKS